MGDEDDVVGGDTRDDAGLGLGGGKGVMELVELVAAEVRGKEGGEGLVGAGRAVGSTSHGGKDAGSDVGEAVLGIKGDEADLEALRWGKEGGLEAKDLLEEVRPAGGGKLVGGEGEGGQGRRRRRGRRW